MQSQGHLCGDCLSMQDPFLGSLTLLLAALASHYMGLSGSDLRSLRLIACSSFLRSCLMTCNLLSYRECIVG